MPHRTIRVLLVDEHPAVRAVMRELIDGEAGMRVIAEASDCAMALDLAARLAVDVAVVDLGLPGAGGPDLVRCLRRLRRGPRVVATSMHQGRHFASAALRAGAAGFVPKGRAATGLVGAIHAAACTSKHRRSRWSDGQRL